MILIHDLRTHNISTPNIVIFAVFAHAAVFVL